jgi:hypothetical protein
MPATILVEAPPPHGRPKCRHDAERDEGKAPENQVISNATMGADAPAPRRPAAWVMPTAVPRAASEVQFDNARVAAGNVALSPMPSTRRTNTGGALIEAVRFASPVEGDGFELPVPRERDLNLTLCRTAGTASSNMSEVRARSAMPIRVGLNALFHDKRLSNPSPA